MGSKYEPVEGEAEKAEGWIEPADDVEEVAVVKIEEVETVPEPTPVSNVAEVAQEVVQGKWGVGQERRRRLSEAGYKVNEVEKEVLRLLND